MQTHRHVCTHTGEAYPLKIARGSVPKGDAHVLDTNYKASHRGQQYQKNNKSNKMILPEK